MEKSALADLATEGSGNDVNDQNHHASATSAHAFACFIGSFRSFSVSGFLWILKDLLGDFHIYIQIDRQIDTVLSIWTPPSAIDLFYVAGYYYTVSKNLNFGGLFMFMGVIGGL